MSNVKLGAISAGLPLALLATYSNHFHNSFHSFGLHAVVQNTYILYNMERPGSKP